MSTQSDLMKRLEKLEARARRDKSCAKCKKLLSGHVITIEYVNHDFREEQFRYHVACFFERFAPSTPVEG